MSDPQPPAEEPGTDGISVFWDPVPPDPDAWEAELPNGERIKPILQLGGRRLGFDRTFPKGTLILHNGRRAYRPIGMPPEEPQARN